MTLQDLLNEGTLKTDAIAEVKIQPLKTKAQIMGHQTYSERPTNYKVKLANGTNFWYRVYATPIGNVSVVYIKAGGRITYCESALEDALSRAEDD
ncbi:hypothetical protein SEA_WESAK_21 [Microbacterium phage Wesak]|uniref:Uncharacterized protein n=1 Tax=Microbacterium phage Wesak TaxID=2653751 RepID=A0A5Q2WJJ9_9CAUD|nr:hypothetical protein SEA_WESAK_21 [Microbacterium phage Wesak]